MASFKDWFRPSKKSVITVDSLNETTREGINKGYIPKFLYKPPFGYPRFANMTYVRYLAQTPYVEMCISTIIDEIASIPWDIVPTEGMEDQEDEAEKEHIKNFFLNPNTNRESFEEVFIRMPVRDILEVNSGVLNKVFNMKEEMVEIVARDGATFTKNPDVHGMFTNRDDIIMPNRIVDDSVGQEYFNPYTEITATSSRERAAYFQYGWIAGPIPVPFGRREIVWMEKMKRTDDHYGFSPVQFLAKSLQMLLYMIESDLEYYNDNNVPKGIIGLDESDADEITAFKEQWFETQRTKDEFGSWKKIMNKVPIVNKTPNFTRIEFSAAEMQVIEKQKWYTKMVWASFGVTAVELGYTEDAKGSANQIVQSKVFRKKAINPMLRNLESNYNMSIVSEFGYFGEIKTPAGKVIKKPKYQFVFKKFDVDEESVKYELYKLQTSSGLKTINEIRKSEGLEDLEWGDDAPKDWMQSDGNNFTFGEGYSNREKEAMNPDDNTQTDVDEKGLRGPPEKPTVDPDAEEDDAEEDDDEDEDEKKAGPGGHVPDKTGPHGSGDGPGEGGADGTGIDKDKKKKTKSLELKFKYVKRTGSPGKYQYWYSNPKTGKLVSGDKPKKDNSILSKKEGNTATERNYNKIVDIVKDKLTSKQIENTRIRAVSIRENGKYNVDVRATLTSSDGSIGSSSIVSMQLNQENSAKQLVDMFNEEVKLKKESKAQEPSNPLILKEGERPIGYTRLERAIRYVNKQNEAEILKFLDAELGKPTLNEVKGIKEIMTKIKSLLGITALKSITEQIIKNNYLKGWEQAEKALNRNILPDKNAIDYMTDYTYDNIKGMNDDIAEKLRGVMQRGFMDGSGKDELKAEILKVFEVGDNRGNMIARTESNRASNFGRLHGYQKSGMPGTKVYSAHMDGRTSPLCKRLNGQEVGLDEDFVDPKGEWKGPVPPAHVNCRSSWTFKVDTAIDHN